METFSPCMEQFGYVDEASTTSMAPTSVSPFGTPAVLMNKAATRHGLADIAENDSTDKGSSWLDAFQ